MPEPHPSVFVCRKHHHHGQGLMSKPMSQCSASACLAMSEAQPSVLVCRQHHHHGQGAGGSPGRAPGPQGPVRGGLLPVPGPQGLLWQVQLAPISVTLCVCRANNRLHAACVASGSTSVDPQPASSQACLCCGSTLMCTGLICLSGEGGAFAGRMACVSPSGRVSAGVASLPSAAACWLG